MPDTLQYTTGHKKWAEKEYLRIVLACLTLSRGESLASEIINHSSFFLSLLHNNLPGHIDLLLRDCKRSAEITTHAHIARKLFRMRMRNHLY